VGELTQKKGSDASSPSGVLVDAEKMKLSVVYSGWRQKRQQAVKFCTRTIC